MTDIRFKASPTPYAVAHRSKPPTKSTEERTDQQAVLTTTTSMTTEARVDKRWPGADVFETMVRKRAVDVLAQHRHEVIRVMGLVSSADGQLVGHLQALSQKALKLKQDLSAARRQTIAQTTLLTHKGEPGCTLFEDDFKDYRAVLTQQAEAESAYHQFLVEHPILGAIDLEAAASATTLEAFRGTAVAGLSRVAQRLVTISNNVRENRIHLTAMGPMMAEVRHTWLSTRPDDATALDEWWQSKEHQEQAAAFVIAGAEVAVSVAAVLVSGGLMAPVLIAAGYSLGLGGFLLSARRARAIKSLQPGPFMPRLTHQDGDRELALAVIGAASSAMALGRLGLPGAVKGIKGGPRRPNTAKAPPAPAQTKRLKAPSERATVLRPSPAQSSAPRHPSASHTELLPGRSHTVVSPSRSGSDVTEHDIEVDDILQWVRDGI